MSGCCFYEQLALRANACIVAQSAAKVKGFFRRFFAEKNTAKCFEWVKEHLVLDEIGIYLQKTNVAESQESVYESLYD